MTTKKKIITAVTGAIIAVVSTILFINPKNIRTRIKDAIQSKFQSSAINNENNENDEDSVDEEKEKDEKKSK